MRLSIVTIAYNQAAFVEAAILSVLGQDYPDLEYIVVDPGSSDGTRAIIERYRDRISQIIYQPDEGAAEGLNNGFARATGQVFGFLNSDDILLPGAAGRVMQAFAENPGADLVMGNMWIIDGEGARIRAAYTDRFNLRAFGYGASTICQQSTFFSAALFRDIGGFNIGNRVAWDAELFLDMLQSPRRHVRLDEMLSGFRIYPGSITGSRRLQRMHRDFFEERFRRVMGRQWRPRDRAIRIFYYLRKYMLEPRALRERMLRGSIRSAATRRWR